MSNKKDQTASFMVRFNQKIFEEDGEPKVQWRGRISHVQGGSDKHFSDFNDALIFMQEKLAELTNEATKGESDEHREGILEKSFSMWNTIKEVAPKMIMDTIKDPKKQISNIQDQIQDQITNISDEIGQKVHIDQWRNASRADFHDIQKSIAELSKEIKALSTKVDKLKKR